jgi:hypothetical protein
LICQQLAYDDILEKYALTAGAGFGESLTASDIANSMI